MNSLQVVYFKKTLGRAKEWAARQLGSVKYSIPRSKGSGTGVVRGSVLSYYTQDRNVGK